MFLLTVGGRQSSCFTTQTREVHILNSSIKWSMANIPAARHFSAAVSMGDRIIVIGGMTNQSNEYSTDQSKQ